MTEPFSSTSSENVVQSPADSLPKKPGLSSLRIALVYPELLGTYGDGGNAEVLAARLALRGLSAEVVPVPAGSPLPASCDLYLLGGGEDDPQLAAAASLKDSPLASAVEAGATLFAVCAGLQILGTSFPTSAGLQDGLSLLPLETRRSFDDSTPPRIVGDLALSPHPSLDLPLLVGYENHAGRTRPLPGAPGHALGRVLRGQGSGTPDHLEGWVTSLGHGFVLATYLHGPALAQNPALADLLLEKTLGHSLPPLPLDPGAALHAFRLAALGLQS